MSPRKKELTPTPAVSKNAQLLDRLRKNSNSIMSCSASANSWRYVDFFNPIQKLPCFALEWLFGCRGLLAGRILQLRATYSKGKSSFMYLTYAAAQALSGAFCFHIETEGASAPPDWVASFGANPEDLLIAELTSLEDCIAKIDELICEVRGGFGGSISAEGREIKSKFTDPIDAELEHPIVMGIDSFSSLGTSSGVNEDIADATKTEQISFHTKKLREYFRKRVGRFRDTQTLLMMSSHETANIQTGGKKSFGGPAKTALAQEAIGIHGTFGVDLAIKPWVDKDAGKRVGEIITLTTFKNKLSPRYRVVDLYLRTGQGFDMIKTDAEFLLGHSDSPFPKEELYRHSRGITCKPLSDKSFGNEQELLFALYNHHDLLSAKREQVRIRGFGFDFESKYQVPNLDEPDEEEKPDGLAGSKEAVS